jgi:hypothetical protein
VNSFRIANAVATGGPSLFADSAVDSNVPVNIFSKGTGAINLRSTNSIFNAVPVAAGGVNSVYVTNATTGNGPTIGATGTDTNVDLNLATTGSSSAVRTTAALVARRFVPRQTSITTTAGSTGIDANFAQTILFTGTVASHRVILPTTSVTAGSQWFLINNSTGVLSIESSNATQFTTLPPGESRTFIAKVDTPTTPAHWGPNDVKGYVAGTPTPLTLWTGTKAQYDAIPAGSRSATTIYVVTAVTAVTGDITSTEGL